MLLAEKLDWKELTPNDSKFRPEKIPASNYVFLEYAKVIFSFISSVELTS
jgi:hypothetical protein